MKTIVRKSLTIKIIHLCFRYLDNRLNKVIYAGTIKLQIFWCQQIFKYSLSLEQVFFLALKMLEKKVVGEWGIKRIWCIGPSLMSQACEFLWCHTGNMWRMHRHETKIIPSLKVYKKCKCITSFFDVTQSYNLQNQIMKR